MQRSANEILKAMLLRIKAYNKLKNRETLPEVVEKSCEHMYGALFMVQSLLGGMYTICYTKEEDDAYLLYTGVDRKEITEELLDSEWEP